MKNNKLNVCLILNSLIIPRWQAFLVGEIISLPFAKVSLIILERKFEKKNSKEFISHFLYILYAWLDSRLFRRTTNTEDPLQPVDLTDRLLDSEQIPVDFTQEKFSTEDTRKIGSFNIDVVLQLTPGRIHKEIAELSRYGLWFFSFGNHKGHTRSLSGFWEIYGSNPVTCSKLLAFTQNKCANCILSISWTATKNYSLYLNRTRIYWKSAHFVVNHLRTIHQYGWEYLLKKRHDMSEENDLSSNNDCPNNWQVIVFMGKISVNLIKKILKTVFGHETWVIGLRQKHDIKDLSCFDNVDKSMFKKIKSNRDGFLADPFIIEHKKKNYIFCEEFLKKERKGIISVIEILNDLNITHPRTVLDRPYHLSYPFLFKWGEELFMIPETSRNRTIELYKCVQFPDQWILDKVLFTSTNAADTTVLYEKGIFWLFTCQNNGELDAYDAFDELYLYWSYDIRGPWYFHPQNPIVSDIRRARCAGAIIRLQNSLIRPSQDCSEKYGKRINFNHIVQLTQTEYREEPLGVFEDIWYFGANGTHTWNSNECFDVIDASIWKFKRFSFFGKS